MRKALNTVTELLPDLDLEPFAAADRLLTRAIDKVGNVALPVGLHDQVRDTAKSILLTLMARGEAEEVQQDQLRVAVASIALPAENELRKLSRYRRMIEDGLDRRLQALSAMKALTAGHQAAEQDAGKAREFRLRLRLVG